MSIDLDTIDTSLAEAACQRIYNLDAECHELEGYLDLNFRVDVEGTPAYVLKVTTSQATVKHWRKETDLMRRLARENVSFSVPSLICTDDDAVVESTHAGEYVAFRLLSWMNGLPVTRRLWRSEHTLKAIGRAAGRMDTVLCEIDDPYFDRKIEWDIRHAASLLPYADVIESATDRQLVKDVLSHFEQRRLEHHTCLPVSVIHNDLNDANIFVDDQHKVGFIDFGDTVRTYRLVEPAVALAYLLMRQDDPFASAVAFLQGYVESQPLTELEADLLYDFVLARLSASVIMSARKKTTGQYDPYHLVSEQDAWRLLRRLSSENRLVATAIFRNASGLPVHHSASEVTSFLKSSPEHILPVRSATDASFAILDFSVDSDAFDPTEPVNPAVDGPLIETMLVSQGASCGIGRYNEPRLCYSTDQFKVEGQASRSIHLGIDFFKPAGTEVLAVFDGCVLSMETTRDELDYGTVVILEHEISEGVQFYSLYGHLSSKLPDSLKVGSQVQAGDVLGELGAPDDNGGWVPHLHFQFMVDMFGFENTFPGVATPDHRDTWLAMCPDPDVLFNVGATYHSQRKSDLLEKRESLLAPSLSLSYENPIHIVRGRGQYLYDADGRQFLDCVNNVCHVGHCHPHVVSQTVGQLRKLNTNTRYLHNNILAYAERLASTFPDPLSVCFLVNSGSEANDLALRLARAATGHEHVVALQAAYHGNLDALIGISSYKFDGPGGAGPDERLILAELPDSFRGRHRDEYAGRRYAQDLCDLLKKRDMPLAAFIAESLPGCGGQIVLPDGYLRSVYSCVREYGGVCIADEVQVGFGRVGESFWGFQLQGVIPDIVTLGKPIANGHPVGAVVTTPAVAKAFSNGMEYFNTFGGNPVSCAAASAVLDVIETEKLQSHANSLGRYILNHLEILKSKYSLVGDVRGKGLYIGVELVKDHSSLAPAAEEARYIVNRLRNKGILLSVDGPLHNVLKFKPPLVFSRTDADGLLDALDTVFNELEIAGIAL